MTPTTQLLREYSPLDGIHDEFVAEPGVLRPHWSHVGNALGELGHAELMLRQHEVDRLLDADGVTYNPFGSGDPRGRRWALDPVPTLIASKDWATIERGVIQRAELFSLILADLYGPRELLKRKLLPAEAILRNPGFLRACARTTPENSDRNVGHFGPNSLTTYAVDIGRDADGNPVALSDRAQAPSGAGYALENRLVMSRVFPSLYRDAQVHRVAPFFRALRRALQRSAANVSDPRIVVLSPGPWSETAFEHAYLASYMGYPLVEGGDLTVEGGRVWMRSLGRLERVDVILRRVDDWFCDPLELKPDSKLGVVGLVDAARRGAVSVVNPLGSGIIESPAILAFLPAIAEFLLGQPLLLPSATTYWCGDDTSRRYVIDHLHELVIKPIARDSEVTTKLGWELSSEAQAGLRDQIVAEPWKWTGQVPVSLSTSPTLTDAGFQARRSVLRSFAVAQGDSFMVMPGGLIRVAPGAANSLISNQMGAVTKDAWVLASEPEQLGGFWLNTGPVVEAAGSMPSRAAENLFWLGRYAERSESVVRLLRVVADRRNEFASGSSVAGSMCLRLLLVALTNVTTTFPGFTEPGRLAEPGQELFDLIVDEDRAGTLAHGVRHLLDAAYAVRDQLSNDTWLVIGNLDREILELRALSSDARSTGVQGALSRSMQSLLAFAGLHGESMVRDPGWHFLDAGRRLERAMHLTALIRATLITSNDAATDSLVMESVLSTAESIITYRRRYRSQAQVQTVLDLLLLDPGNPRSLSYQLERLQQDIAQLPRSRSGKADRLSAEERLVLEASTMLRLADTATLASTDSNGARLALGQFLVQLDGLLRETANAIDSEHFARQMPQHAFGPEGWAQ
jgi:uncharacterized circularly permuted ATP-grasp superfamily protein/uncharacterized alpha-E superfamily protein